MAWGWVVFSMLRDKNPARWEYEPWSPPPFSAVIVGTRGVGVGPEACVLTCACLALPKLTAFSAPVLPLNVRNTQVHGDGGVGGGAIASIHSQALCPSLSSQVLTVRITHSTVTCTTQNRPNVECSVLPVPSTRRGCTYRPASGSEGGGVWRACSMRRRIVLCFPRARLGVPVWQGVQRVTCAAMARLGVRAVFLSLSVLGAAFECCCSCVAVSPTLLAV